MARHMIDGCELTLRCYTRPGKRKSKDYFCFGIVYYKAVYYNRL
jgi:hypothetical protein